MQKVMQELMAELAQTAQDPSARVTEKQLALRDKIKARAVEEKEMDGLPTMEKFCTGLLNIYNGDIIAFSFDFLGRLAQQNP